MDVVEIGRNYAPDHRLRRQEAPKRVLATPAAFLHLVVAIPWQGRRWGGVCSFQVARCCCGLQGPGKRVVVVGHPRVLALPVPLG